MAYVRFQSTPLTRGETTFKAVFRNTPQFQSTPLTRGETLAANTDALTANVFQSTPLTRGETAENRGERFLRAKFQSTPLTRGETNWKRIWSRSSMISIHSPHTRGDSFRLRISEWQHNFNPLPSHEGRRTLRLRRWILDDFNPLPSHEGRQDSPERLLFLDKFQSTPLTRGETAACMLRFGVRAISIHSPHTRGDIQRHAHLH